jgi:hypothetical protein
MAVRDYYVDTDVGSPDDGSTWLKAYATLVSAYAAAVATEDDLVTTEDSVVFHCRASSGTADTTQVILDGFTTSATYSVEVHSGYAGCSGDPDTCSEGDYHDGVWDGDEYTIEVANTAVRPTDEHIKLWGLQIQATDGAAGRYCYYNGVVGTAEHTVENCIFKGHASGSNWQIMMYISDADITHYMSNCLFFNGNIEQTSSECIRGGAGTHYIYNCSLVENYYGIRLAGSSTNCVNVLSDCADTRCFVVSSGTMTCNYCASQDATANDWDNGDSGNNQTDQTFTFVDSGADDFHLHADDTGATDLGADLSGYDYAVTVDIDNVTRDGTWDIGCDEYVAVGGALTVSVSDTIVATDVVSLLMPLLQASVSDTIVATDAVSLLMPLLQASVSDTVVATDAVTMTLPLYNVNVDDTIAVVDSVTISLPLYTVSVSDTAAVIDAVSAAIPGTALTVSVFDSVVVTDNIGNIIMNPLLVSVSDTIAATDIASVEAGPIYTLYGITFLYTEDNWASSSLLYYEVYMKATTGRVYARLYNVTDGTGMLSSQVSTAGTSLERVRSNALTLVDGKEYRVQVGKFGSDAGEMVGAKLIIL